MSHSPHQSSDEQNSSEENLSQASEDQVLVDGQDSPEDSPADSSHSDETLQAPGDEALQAQAAEALSEHISEDVPASDADTVEELAQDAEILSEHISEDVPASDTGTIDELAHDDEKKVSHKERYEAFLVQMQEAKDPDDKLSRVVAFMEAALSTKHGTPFFKSFWDARVIAMELFKENINPTLRTELWGKYSELSKEARRLKEMLDEQSAFATEQIEIAISALEKEQNETVEMLEKASSLSFLEECPTLAEVQSVYYQTQGELNFLNAHAGRITALRKELIRTEMRVRQKNKFFQRLSLAGDKVFPRRKDLIKEISHQFSNDVEAFVQKYFASEDIQESPFYLREEIKALQNVAKLLTLNTQAFSHTRMKLSEAWDKLKNVDKERKKARAQHRAVSRDNADQLSAKLLELKTAMEDGSISFGAANLQLDGIVNDMHTTELGRDELRELREQISAVRKPIMDKQRNEEQERLHLLQEKDRLKKALIQEVKDEILAVMNSVESYTSDEIIVKKETIQQKISDLPTNKSEKQELERMLKPLQDVLVDKREQALMALSEDDRQAMQQLKEVLKQRKEQQREIKAHLEHCRKMSGSSRLDFEQAMNFNKQIADEKERLERVSQGIREIESKIGHLELKSGSSK